MSTTTLTAPADTAKPDSPYHHSGASIAIALRRLANRFEMVADVPRTHLQVSLQVDHDNQESVEVVDLLHHLLYEGAVRPEFDRRTGHYSTPPMAAMRGTWSCWLTILTATTPASVLHAAEAEAYLIAAEREAYAEDAMREAHGQILVAEQPPDLQDESGDRWVWCADHDGYHLAAAAPHFRFMGRVSWNRAQIEDYFGPVTDAAERDARDAAELADAAAHPLPRRVPGATIAAAETEAYAEKVARESDQRAFRAAERRANTSDADAFATALDRLDPDTTMPVQLATVRDGHVRLDAPADGLLRDFHHPVTAVVDEAASFAVPVRKTDEAVA